MLVDSVFNIIELLLNILINIKLLADCQNSKISPKIYQQICLLFRVRKKSRVNFIVQPRQSVTQEANHIR